ncbi:transcriptional regulatory protein [Hirschfeldia incana]|nr:transcriptional regulatory protein [Hirschfeldia incana]
MASSHCTMRGAVGVLLLRFSTNGSVVSSRSILNSAKNHHRRLLTTPNSLSSLSSISTHTTSNFTPSHAREQNCTNRQQVRKIWICSPLCMGRRSSKIAGRKGAQDSKKAKLYCKIGKEVVSAVRKGGPNPVSNTVLATILEKAKDLDVPKDIVERNIKRASEKGQEDFIEKIYEVYGYGGVSMVVEVLTDKINRSVAAVRSVLKDYGGKMADSGSVMFKFRRVRVVNIKVTEVDKDQLFIIALDAGAEDVIDPPSYEDDTDEDREERYYKIVTSNENYSTVLSKLRDEGVNFEPDNGSELLPLTTVEVDDEAMELNRELMQKLLELDDVDAVYIDQK